MCRIAAYVGVPRTLDALLFHPPHSLEVQAYAPREQVHGHLNVDGTGVAWWPHDAPGPRRYATSRPPWADDNLRELADLLPARAMIAAVRGATPGMPADRGAIAPFVAGSLAVAHNGWVGGFRCGVGSRLLAELPAEWHAALGVVSDSSLLALHVAAGRAAGATLVDAVVETVQRTSKLVRDAGEAATLTLVASDGRSIVASRTSVDAPCNSLYVLGDGDPPWTDGALVASEPLDEASWQPVAAGHVVEVRPGRVTDVGAHG